MRTSGVCDKWMTQTCLLPISRKWPAVKADFQVDGKRTRRPEIRLKNGPTRKVSEETLSLFLASSHFCFLKFFQRKCETLGVKALESREITNNITLYCHQAMKHS
ncbi:hypothetical protein L596_028928 [Steinernema carpocapsae]|uniref:Uncharacterized protein n=1 Tax=Steinernema carpocapsae TaxID=34508 RepID=A0A4V5ZY13_STECR|nr:hypothetical protein L596_028928 [Steinernema carpocapsae]